MEGDDRRVEQQLIHHQPDAALAVSLVTLAEADEWPLAAGYLAVSLVAGLGAATAGLFLGRRPEPIGPED